jgi:hypothetical protein
MMAVQKSKRFSVYVILLDQGVLQSRKFRDDNPNFKESMDCYYVGMTSSTAEKRFEQHKLGYKSCRFVKEFGLELMPARFSQCNPKTYENAMRHERKVANRLQRKGYGVWQR